MKKPVPPAGWRLRAMGALLGAAIVATSAFAQLSASSGTVSAGQNLSITLDLANARTDSGYLALMYGGAIFFLDENGALSPYQAGAPTPRRLALGTQGRHTLFSLAIPPGLTGTADFYAAFGQSGVDVLATPGALDMASLQHVGVTLTAAATSADGRSLYLEHCASCHGSNPLNNVDRILRGRDAATTLQAIATDKGGMGYLQSFITDAEHATIAAWLANPV
jgi:mono/diheme cytochrome c family protein